MNQRLVWDKIANSWNNFRNKPMKGLDNFSKYVHGKTLFFGCGNGRNFKVFNAEIYGIDISLEMLKNVKGGAHLILGNEKLPLRDSSFDSVVAISSVHCIKDRETLFTEFSRVLKPNGTLLISVWRRWQWRFFPKNIFSADIYVPWKKRDGILRRYYHLYSSRELKRDLKSFEIVEMKKIKGNIFAVATKKPTSLS